MSLMSCFTLPFLLIFYFFFLFLMRFVVTFEKYEFGTILYIIILDSMMILMPDGLILWVYARFIRG